jgi:hypothetical protein
MNDTERTTQSTERRNERAETVERMFNAYGVPARGSEAVPVSGARSRFLRVERTRRPSDVIEVHVWIDGRAYPIHAVTRYTERRTGRHVYAIRLLDPYAKVSDTGTIRREVDGTAPVRIASVRFRFDR